MGNESKQEKVICSLKQLNPSTKNEKIKCIVAPQPVTDAILIPEFFEVVVLTASESKKLKAEVKKYDKYINDIQASYASKDQKTIGTAKDALADFMAKEAKKASKGKKKGTQTATTTTDNSDILITKFIEIIELNNKKYSYVTLDLIDSFRKSGLKKTHSLKALGSGSAGAIGSTAKNSNSNVNTITGANDTTVVPPQTRDEKVKNRWKSGTVKISVSKDLLGPNNKPIEIQLKLTKLLELSGLDKNKSSAFAVKWAKTFDDWVTKVNEDLKWTLQDRKIRQDNLCILLDPMSTPGLLNNPALKDSAILTTLQNEVNSIWSIYLTDPRYTKLQGNEDIQVQKRYMKELQNHTWNTFAGNTDTLKSNCKIYISQLKNWFTPQQRRAYSLNPARKIDTSGPAYKRKAVLYNKLKAKVKEIEQSEIDQKNTTKDSKSKGQLFDEVALGHVQNEVEYIWENTDDEFVKAVKKLTWTEFAKSNDALINNRTTLLSKIKNKKLPPYWFNASASAQFMRFTAGKSITSNFDFAKGRVGLKAEVKVDLALVEGKTNCQFFIPDNEGVELSLPTKNKTDEIVWKSTNIVKAEFNTYKVDKTFLLPVTMKMLAKVMKSSSMMVSLDGGNGEKNRFQVIGHADPDGAADYNMVLSKQRSKVAYDFLTYNHKAWYQRFEAKTWGDNEILTMVRFLSGDNKKTGKLQDKYWTNIVGGKLWSKITESKYFEPINYKGKKIGCSVKNPESTPNGIIFRRHNRLGTKTTKDQEFLRHLIQAYMREITGNDFLLTSAFMSPAYDGKGETELVSANKSDYHKNRRVEVHLKKRFIKGTKSTVIDIPLGFMRLQLELYITGYVGANAMASAELGFGVENGAVKMLGMRSGEAENLGKDGAEQPEDNGVRKGTTTTVDKSRTATTKTKTLNSADKIDLNNGLSAEVGAFAGASATAGAKGLLEWKCPSPDMTLKEPNIVVATESCGSGLQAAKVIKMGGLKNSFAELASAGYSLTASAGIGISGEFKIGFDSGTGKFVFKIAASVTYGLGAGGAWEFSIGVKNVYWFIRFVHAQLNDHNFSYLEFFEDGIYDMFSAWSLELYKNGYKITGKVVEIIGKTAIIILKTIDLIVDAWEAHQVSSKIAVTLAAQINSGNALMTYLSPDVKGRILDNLCYGEWLSRDIDKETAILKVLGTLSSYKEYYEIVERMSGAIPEIGVKYNNKLVTKESREQIKAEKRISNEKKLTAMLNDKDEEFSSWKIKLPKVAPKMAN